MSGYRKISLINGGKVYERLKERLRMGSIQKDTL